MSKNFFACKIVVAANQRYPEKFKDFCACKIVLAATHQYSENVQRFFRLQNFRSRKSAISWKLSKIFPPAKISQPQTICILEIFKDFFACKLVIAANHRYPGNIQRLFRLQNCRSSNPSIHQYSENVQELFRLQNCRSRKSAISWKQSKIFPPAKMSQQQPINILKSFKDFLACKNVLAANHLYPGNIQRLFRLQICLSRKSSISWKYSKIFSPANLSQPQIIDILEIFKDFFACKIVVAATHQYINILKMFKNFFACKIVVAANQRYPGNIQRFFRLQNCLSSNPSKFSKYSKTFSPAKLSLPQIIDVLEIFKDLFACKNFSAATHHYSEKIQRLFRLRNCLSRKSSISWKYSKTFSAANLSQPQIIYILEIFKDFFACKIVVAATHQYIIILKMFKNFFACKIVVVANQRYPGIIQIFFRLQKFLSSNPSIF